MKELASYTVESEGVPAEVAVIARDDDFINSYELRHTRVKQATKVILDYLKRRIVEAVNIKVSEVLDPRETEKVKKRLVETARQLVKQELRGLSDEEEKILVGRLIQEMVGLGEIELLLADGNLEEIVVNSAKEPVFVYHKQFGWLRTNLTLSSEEQIHNFASIIGRRVGKQITNLTPLMDASLIGGSRVNATLFPISAKGNGFTIRKFREDPWTIVDLISNNTLNAEVASLIWLAVQYELNTLIAGGTASGKTSFLNAILVFTPPNQRIVSIEDTKELVLPDFLHWTPLITRLPNPEGKGGVEMLDLMVNSLRMRPDRIVVGEIRRQREAEVLFEAMHTGHSVYATLHADNAAQVRNRLINPPIAIPEPVLEALHLIVVQYRQRRSGIRRTFELAEVMPEENKVSMNVLYSWDPREDKLQKLEDSSRLFSELALHTGFTTKETEQDLREKQAILKYLIKQGVRDVNSVGKVSALYYRDKDRVLKIVESNGDKKQLLG
ncbi:TPA: CpaF family protein [Candidatus Micrarchaeota archaeon]|nr:CpaF family protein [Candidatus Micrarchaeota archaeon]